jgi:hypothetical protein
MKSNAYISPDGKYRYWLIRVWNSQLPLLAIIGVNPSTADWRKNDQTILKDIGFAARLGFGGLLKLNVAAYRETDPRKCRKAIDPVGPENSVGHLLGYIEQFKPSQVIVAWGKNGNYFIGRCEAIVREIPNLYCFGRNNDGTPRHPLRLPYSTPLQPFTAIQSH